MRDRVSEANGSYRQGLILGLTMAELMLLLVFCLLIAVAALLGSERLKLENAEAALEQARQEKATAEALLEEVKAAGKLASLAPPDGATVTDGASGSPVDDMWQRLVTADGTIRKLEAAGLDPKTLVEDATFHAKLADLARNRSAQSVLADVALADELRRRLGLDTQAPLSPDQVTASAAEALQTADRARVAAEQRVASLEEEVEALKDVVPARPGKSTDLPPIITLKEDQGFFFDTGRASLGPRFAARLHDETAARLAELVARYDVDVIEVIGHTDERPLGKERASNLDGELLKVVGGAAGVDTLVPADNAGLGLARAVAVAQVLKSDARLRGLDILPLSAAQLVDTDGHLTAGDNVADVAERRRIEIRLRRANEG
ncbi:hypothetical protein [Chthonobacter albigriseus]|uniref:hypothetical protein n=1 Tax=Chthonobacter albigriseus TaxID=1683161 RepID=UPI0015EF529B|nr:hypothetical protein [Chthonobacter albigriseus]